MKKSIALLIAFLALFGGVIAQTKDLGKPLTKRGKIEATKNFYQTPKVDVAAEMALYEGSAEKMMRFGKEFSVNIDVMAQADQRILPSGDVLYQFGIACQEALSVNVIFNKFHLAAGSKLYITDAESDQFIGAYTSFNNNLNNMLGTELLNTSKIIIELQEPKEFAGTSQLILGTIVHGYRDLNQIVKALNDSGNCHYDANCPQGNTWVNQKNSVAMMVNGGGFCTGSLVNNTSGTIIPYFLSANHCGTNPGGWVFRFRWETPAAQTVCGTGGNSANGPETMNVNGGILRANWSGSDFTLTELNTAPDPLWGIYYSGWDNSGAAVSSAVGIHHPRGDIKKISFENNALTSTAWSGTPANSHWHVPGWDLGVTEPASSGSPLFDQNRRIIGQLHGGASACGNNDLSDEYGKFSFSWIGNNSNSTRLSNWLDPAGTGATAIDGVDPAGPGAAVDAALNNPQGVSGTYCATTVTPQVTITNSGTDVLTSCTINYGYDGVLNQTYPWTGSLAQYQTATITLSAATLGGGNHTFDAVIVNPNGSTDENLNNNTISSSFTTVVNGQSVILDLSLDCWGSETSWELLDGGGALLYSGSGYEDSNPITVTTEFCLAQGCYNFKIMDSFNDGMTGCSTSNGGNGSYQITYNSAVVAELLEADANFANESIKNFCISVNSLNEKDLATQVSVYPNPASADFAVVSNGVIIQKVELLNLAGQVIRTVNSNDQVVKLDVNSVSSGVYLVKIYSAEGSTTKQLIIK
jgi:hypothetical protein